MKYIRLEELEDILDNHINNDNNGYVCVDKIIKQLKKIDGINVRPIRKIDYKICTLETLLYKDLNSLHKSAIENETANYNEYFKISRRTLIDWEKSMRLLGYRPKHNDYWGGEMDINELVRFLKSMQNDQEKE
ncbi:MAG: hypothetical protein SNH27_17655 [Rikenellaceae bacterium]